MLIEIVSFTKNNKIIVLLLIILTISVLLSNNQSKTFAFAQSDIKLLTYKNEDIGLEIQYPQDWIPLERGKYPSVKSPTVVVFFYNSSNPGILDNSHDIISQVFFKINIESTNASLEEYYNLLKNRILIEEEARGKLFQPDDSNPTISGKPGRHFVGIFEDYKVNDNFTIDDGKAYRLTFYITPEYDYYKYKNLIQKMLNSFKITK